MPCCYVVAIVCLALINDKTSNTKADGSLAQKQTIPSKTQPLHLMPKYQFAQAINYSQRRLNRLL